MTKKHDWRRWTAWALIGACAAVLLSAVGLSIGVAAQFELAQSLAPANQQPTNPVPPPARDINPFEDVPPAQPTTPTTPGTTRPAPLQGPTGTPSATGPGTSAPAPSIPSAPSTPSGAEQRMPGPDPFGAAAQPRAEQPAQRERAIPEQAVPFDTGEATPQYSEAEQTVQKGRALLSEGKFEEALRHFQEAVRLEPKQADAYFWQGVVYRILDQYDKAVEAYSAAIPLTPEEYLAELYFRRGVAWFYKGEYGIAFDDFDEATIFMELADPRPDLWKGLAKARQGKWRDALTDYDHSLERSSYRYAPAYINRGLAYLALNEPAKAVDDFDQAIRQEPGNAANYFKRGVAQSRAGRVREAVDSYSQAIRLKPDYAEAYFNRSLANRRLGESQQAGKDRAEALRINPNIERILTSAG